MAVHQAMIVRQAPVQRGAGGQEAIVLRNGLCLDVMRLAAGETGLPHHPLQGGVGEQAAGGALGKGRVPALPCVAIRDYVGRPAV